jgi:hypothetical protein
MADPLSVAGSIAGILALSGAVFRAVSSFKRFSAGAQSTVAELATQTRNLSGILQNLSLLAAALEADSPARVPSTFKAQHLHSCRQTLLKIEGRLKKGKDDFGSGKRVKSVTRSLTQAITGL